ncbi:glycoside hydrolase family 2 TIM barrel-domain containing protein [Pelagicoccus mobilis]
MAAYASASESPRVTADFNFDWKFHLGDLPEAAKSGFDANAWKDVRLPHDWSIELPYSEDLAGATAFLPGGIGWYRKRFEVSAGDEGKKIWIEFDGVYTNSQVWLNGVLLGSHPNGYTPFKYDLSEHLNYGGENVIAVRVDRSAYIDCRWYPGSGIYRNVKLVTTSPVHIPQWGVFVSTPHVSGDRATVQIQTDLTNGSPEFEALTVETELVFDSQVHGVARTSFRLRQGEHYQLRQNIELKNPQLWDVDTPVMYDAVSRVYAGGELVDMVVTPFGARSFRFDKDTGFYLNGRNRLLKGVCLHHDGGLVGAAVPKGVWRRRLEKLKEAGVNAIRTAHNPTSAEFLDLCDEMGFLVQDEAFDEWNNPKDKRHNYNQQEASPLTKGYTEFFSEWSERDLKAMVLRDRNHPSIIMWSIGNEIEWTYQEYQDAPGYWGENKVEEASYYWTEPGYSIEQIKENFENAPKGEYNLAETAQRLADWVREVDLSRPVTANLVIPSVSNFSGYAEALDLVGLSYRQSMYDYCRRNYPEMNFLGTENWTRYHEWKPVLEKEFISGIFLWTGISYMGESREWPRRGSRSGLLDLAGFESPSFHMFKSLWSEEPHVYMATQPLEGSPYRWDETTNELVDKEENWAARQKWGWQNVQEHWDFQEGAMIAVEVYTNQSEVELFLNGKSYGVRKLLDTSDHILKWFVPYSPGELKAVAADAKSSIRTTGEFSQISLSADRLELDADAYDVSHFVVQLLDEDGTPIRDGDREVTFEIEGNARLLGVDNGSVLSVQPHKSKRIVTSNGQALMILQSTREASEVTVRARSGNVVSQPLKLIIR